jgi:tRNA A-37 threonylcarbamoyl transferase component Bud32
MNFGTGGDRIGMAQNIINIVKFLHKYNIYHNDLQGHNFLIEDNDYAKVYIIDFDQATFNSSSEK